MQYFDFLTEGSNVKRVAAGK